MNFVLRLLSSMRYQKLSDIPSHLEDKFTVCYMGDKIYFTVFDSPKEFVAFYKNVPIAYRHYYEVIRKNRRKLILDIDIDISEEDIVGLKEHLEDLLNSKVVVFSSCTFQKTSYHIVVLGQEFSIDQCKSIVNSIDPTHSICDKSIYKTNQMFRIEGSTKYKQYRYKYLLGKDSLSCNMKAYFAYSFAKEVKPINVPKTIITDSNYNIPKEYRIRKYVSDYLISLTRISPGMCNICKRIHDSENGYLVRVNNQWDFRCFRQLI